MSLDVILLACLCGAAHAAAPNSLSGLSESEIDGYCRGRRRDAWLIGGELVSEDDARVNVVSETDSEKEPPAAVQPQLSWRASAPEYGTFE